MMKIPNSCAAEHHLQRRLVGLLFFCFLFFSGGGSRDRIRDGEGQRGGCSPWASRSEKAALCFSSEQRIRPTMAENGHHEMSSRLTGMALPLSYSAALIELDFAAGVRKSWSGRRPEHPLSLDHRLHPSQAMVPGNRPQPNDFLRDDDRQSLAHQASTELR